MAACELAQIHIVGIVRASGNIVVRAAVAISQLRDRRGLGRRASTNTDTRGTMIEITAV